MHLITKRSCELRWREEGEEERTDGARRGDLDKVKMGEIAVWFGEF